MTLRDDLRTAFERQQSTLGEMGDARHRLVRRAVANGDMPASRGWQWVAAIAAILMATIVITTFALVKAGGRNVTVPVATPSPRAQASPTPLANQIDVPDSTPLILYHDPANFDQLDGVTWDGKTSGRLGLGVTRGGTGDAQGTLYETGTDIRNRAGAVVDTFDVTAAQPFFADDGVHYCDTTRTKPRDVSGPGMLQFGTVGQAPRDVATVGVIGAAQMQGGGPVVIACSPAADRAVVYQAPPGGVGVVRFWVIQLSSGQVIWSSNKSGAWIAASHDGRFVALSQLGGPSTIFDTNGSVAGTVNATVFTFSWDDALAVVAPDYGGSPSVVDWRDGQTIWTCPNNSYQYVQSFAEPGGTHLAIGAADPSYKNTNGFQPVDLFVVGPDGVAVFEKKDVTLFQY